MFIKKTFLHQPSGVTFMELHTREPIDRSYLSVRTADGSFEVSVAFAAFSTEESRQKVAWAILMLLNGAVTPSSLIGLKGVVECIDGIIPPKRAEAVNAMEQEVIGLRAFKQDLIAEREQLRTRIDGLMSERDDFVRKIDFMKKGASAFGLTFVDAN